LKIAKIQEKFEQIFYKFWRNGEGYVLGSGLGVNFEGQRASLDRSSVGGGGNSHFSGLVGGKTNIEGPVVVILDGEGSLKRNPVLVDGFHENVLGLEVDDVEFDRVGLLGGGLREVLVVEGRAGFRGDSDLEGGTFDGGAVGEDLALDHAGFFGDEGDGVSAVGVGVDAHGAHGAAEFVGDFNLKKGQRGARSL
jgi:hypothetical protein